MPSACAVLAFRCRAAAADASPGRLCLAGSGSKVSRPTAARRSALRDNRAAAARRRRRATFAARAVSHSVQAAPAGTATAGPRSAAGAGDDPPARTSNISQTHIASHHCFRVRDTQQSRLSSNRPSVCGLIYCITNCDTGGHIPSGRCGGYPGRPGPGSGGPAAPAHTSAGQRVSDIGES